MAGDGSLGRLAGLVWCWKFRFEPQNKIRTVGLHDSDQTKF